MAAYRMGKDLHQLYNGQRSDLQIKQRTQEIGHQKTNNPVNKMGSRPKQIHQQMNLKWLKDTYENAQHP